MVETVRNCLSVLLRDLSQKDVPPLLSLEGALHQFLKASSLLYGRAHAFRLWLYKVHICQRERLPTPVISVGNISWGGNGKTPMVDYLTIRMLSAGLRPLVLVRGGWSSDEAQLLSQRFKGTGAIIGVGSNRFKVASNIFTKHGVAPSENVRRSAMTLAIDREEDWEVVGDDVQSGGVGVVILDDGMQHLSLERDLEIVMVNAVSYFGNGHLIPCGPLREPLSALQRADAIVLHHADLVTDERRLDLTADLRRFLRPHTPILSTHFAPKHLVRISGLKKGRQESLKVIREVAVVALSGIGCPKSLELLLLKLGAKRVESRAFGDHHSFFKKDLLSVLTLLRALQDSRQYTRCIIVTTEKDYARCSRVLEAVLSDTDCFALVGSLELDGPTGQLDVLLSEALQNRRPRDLL